MAEADPQKLLDETIDALLLLSCDSLLSLIRHREKSGLTEQTIREIDQLLPSLRARTNALNPRPSNFASGSEISE